MVLQAVRPDAVVLDVLGTLFDPGRLGRAFAEHGLGPLALELWLARVQRDGIALAATGMFTTFDELAAYHLQQLLRAASRPPDVAQRLLAALDELDAYPDAAPALELLAAERVRIVTLSNDSAARSAQLLERAGLAGHVERSFDAAAVLAWKPRREAYAQLAAALRLETERLALISAHPWDLHGATAAGLLGAWVDREQREPPPMMNRPTVRRASLVEVAQRLLALEP